MACSSAALVVATVQAAALPCHDSSECKRTLAAGSECGADGYCTNPFYKGGCLKQLQPTRSKIRACNSLDNVGGDNGACHIPTTTYPEVRIAGQNWESAVFHAWVLQILLSELLDVPAVTTDGLDFYDPSNSWEFGASSYDYEGLRVANELGGDCRQLQDDDEQSCMHVMPEVWEGQRGNVKALEKEGVVESPALGFGMLGWAGWYIPKFTGERDPTLMSFMGLQGEQNRRKLAETFLRPTHWKDYCDLVSLTNCKTDDGVASRAPATESEETSYYAEGLYGGHFRATEKNDCDLNPTTCSGHIVDFPCGWSSFVKQKTHHLNIALESNGEEPISGGYTYAQMTQIWAAANHTRQNVMMQWWEPEALFQTYIGTDAEFENIHLPPPTQECMEARVNPLDRCSGDAALQVGEAVGSCDDPPVPVIRLVAESLHSMTNDPSIPDALRSPAFDAVQGLTLSGLQLGVIFKYWLEQGKSDPREAVCRWFVENIEEIEETLVPLSYPRVVEEKDVTRTPIFYGSLTTSIVAIALTIVALACTYKFRGKIQVKNAQVVFLFLLLGGLLMVATGAFVLVLPPSNLSCITAAWLINLGYTLELVPLVVKVAAINKLMTAARRMRRVKLERTDLLRVVFALCSIVVAFMILWTILDPPKQNPNYDLTEQENDNGATIVLSSTYCSSDDMFWYYITIAWHVILLICATVLSFQMRRAPHQVNESMTLAILIYSQAVFVMMRVAAFSLENSSEVMNVARYQSLIYSGDVMATCCIYFFPKFFRKEEEYYNAGGRSTVRVSVTSFLPPPVTSAWNSRKASTGASAASTAITARRPGSKNGVG